MKKQKVDYDPFRAGKISAPLTTTESQREILTSILLDESATLCYNESLVLELDGTVSFVHLEQAFAHVIKRHDSLRLIFSGDGKSFFVCESVSSAIGVYDLSREDDVVKKLEEFKSAQVRTKIDVINGPCFFGTFIRLSSVQSVFVFTAHHLICDGWSFTIILREFSEIYSLLKNGQSLKLLPAPQFSTFAIEESRRGPDLKQMNYWVNEFRDLLEHRPLPSDLPRPASRTYESHRFDIEVPFETVRLLKKFGASQGSSFYTVLMASFQILVMKLTGHDETVVGMASAAQAGLGLTDLVGHLVNLLPLRTKVNPDLVFSDFLKQVRNKMLDGFENQNVSYGALLKQLNLKRTAGESPLLSIVFNIDQQNSGQGLNFEGVKASYTTVPRAYENFDLFINAVSCETGLVLECQYNNHLFIQETIQNWLSNYAQLLAKIPVEFARPVSDFELSGLFIPTQTERREKTVLIPGSEVIEKKLCEVWIKILGIDRVSSGDNFFTLGGHSLLAIELALVIQDTFQQSFSVRDVFELPTLSEMAAKLSSLERIHVKPSEHIYPTSIKNSYPVSHNQMQVWYLEEMYPKTLMHNLPSSIRLQFAIDKRVLERTLSHLIARHPALRTIITVEAGVPVQILQAEGLPQFIVKLEMVETTESDIQALLNREALCSIDKEVAPLFHAKLFKLGEEDYVFFFMVHHAVWDGWSFDIFFEELDLIYSAFSKGQLPLFKNNPDVSYVDYTEHVHGLLQKGELHHQLEFWKTKLKGPLPILELPLDHKRPMQASHEGETFPFELDLKEASALRRYAKEQGASLFNVILTAFKVTLSRYSNVDDIIVGLPVRARNNPQLRHVIGYFVNTVALRSQIDLKKSFEEILREVQSNCVEAFDHQDIPFQVVLNEIQYSKDAGRSPVFQTFFSYQDVSNRQALLNGYPYTQINIDKCSTHTDFDLWIKASDEKLEGAFEFRKDLFSKTTVKLFFEVFTHLLSSLEKNKDLPLLSRSALPPSQENLLTSIWNKPIQEMVDLQPFQKSFEMTVQAHPSHVAIETLKESLSYKDLDTLANKVAQGLIRSGVERGDLVGISLTREPKMIIGLLGILKAGAGYVPLDPSFPQERLQFMMSSSRPKKLLTGVSQAKVFSKFDNLIFIDDLLNDKRLPSDKPIVPIKLEDTAYVIYTSGSTGAPKGVQVSHRAFANFLESMGKEPGLTKKDKLLAVTTLSFDIAGLELFLPLTKGATVFLASSYDIMDGGALKELILNRHINIMQATPSTWRLLLSSGWTGAPDFKVLCGGEAFPIDLAQKLLSICGSVWNMYGPTETTVWSACKKLTKSDAKITIGNAIDNTTLYILDHGLNLSPIGTPGELYIGGLGLADGYYGSLELTEQRFLPNPFAQNKKIYATGDFARFTSDGEVECLGRADGQVKVRGYRIELEEIEHVLSESDLLAENAVILKEVSPGDVRIFACLVLKKNVAIDENGLREFVGLKLPKYMIPSQFLVFPELPKTLNGKVDKKLLATANPLPPESSTEELLEVRPSSSSQVETDLKNIWMDVLGTKEIRSNDNFFNSGGNSLLAVQLFSRISKKFKLNLPLSLLFESNDFHAFVGAIQSKLQNLQSPRDIASVGNPYSSLVSIKASGTKNPIFCFHGVGGNVLNYVSLQDAVGDSRPLIGVQAMGMDGLNPMPKSLEEMARFYCEEIKRFHPTGPYYLAGGSMGGMIAFEVAQQLTKNGDRIEKLVMFDTFGPDIRKSTSRDKDFLNDLKKSFQYRQKVFFNKAYFKILQLLGLPVPLKIRLFEVEVNNFKTLRTYVASKYIGDIHLIRARMRSTGWYSDPYMGWSSKIQGKISTYEIDGTHEDFIENPELRKAFSKLT